MARLKSFLIAIILISCSLQGRGQLYFTALEIGVAGGGSQYFGDLNEHYGFKTIHAAGGFYARQRLNSYIAVKLLANYTKVGYDDKYSDVAYQKLRNLNFESDIAELAIQAEFNFFSFITGDRDHRFTPFLTGGVGIFYYDPYTEYKGSKVYLRPLGTEGQNAGYSSRKYTTASPCFPVGAGVKWWIKGGVNLTVEIADRLTTTDYLDDVSSTYVGVNRFKANSTAAALQDRSQEIPQQKMIGQSGKQRGNTASYDQYMMAMISLSFNLRSYKCPRFMRNDDELRIR